MGAKKIGVPSWVTYLSSDLAGGVFWRGKGGRSNERGEVPLKADYLLNSTVACRERAGEKGDLHGTSWRLGGEGMGNLDALHVTCSDHYSDNKKVMWESVSK